MRCAAERGRWPAIIAVMLAASACSPQCGLAAGNPSPSTSPVAAVPSPSPTPTTPLAASSPPFHSGEAGVDYAPVTLSVTGGAPPYRWSVVSGGLPDGLTLGGEGKVSGSPTAAGTYSFTIQVADSGDGTATIPGTISIAEQLTASLLPACAQYCRVELGCDSTCGAFGTRAGGIAPYAYTLTQGPLPAGTSLNGLALAGTFKGLTGWLQFSVQVSDALGGTASVSPKFWIYDHLALAGGTCGPSRVQCTVTLSYSGGTPGQQVTASAAGWAGANCGFTSSQPCPQPELAAAYQAGAVILTLTYQPNFPATFGTLTVELASTDPCGSGAQCSATASVNVQG